MAALADEAVVEMMGITSRPGLSLVCVENCQGTFCLWASPSVTDVYSQHHCFRCAAYLCQIRKETDNSTVDMKGGCRGARVQEREANFSLCNF